MKEQGLPAFFPLLLDRRAEDAYNPLQETREERNPQVAMPAREDLEKELREIAAGLPDGPYRRTFLEYIPEQTPRFAHFLERLAAPGGPKPRRVLDAGSFPGALTLLLKRRGFDVAAIAQDLESLPAYAPFLDTLEKFGVPYTVCDLERGYVPFPRSSFDLVVFTEVIEHLAFHPFHALGEICRLLKPGGAVWISTPNLASARRALRLLRGGSFHTALWERWAGVFPTAPGAKHEREYTAGELRFFLDPGDRYAYRFRDPEATAHNWFKPPADTGPRLRFAESLLTWLFPHLDNALFARGSKPESLEIFTPAERTLEGNWAAAEDPVAGAKRSVPATYPYPFRYLRREGGDFFFRLPDGWPPRPARARLLLPWIWHQTEPPLPDQPVRVEERAPARADGQAEGMTPFRLIVRAASDMRLLAVPIGVRSADGPREIRLRLTPEAPVVPDEILRNGDRVSTGPALAEAHWALEYEG